MARRRSSTMMPFGTTTAPQILAVMLLLYHRTIYTAAAADTCTFTLDDGSTMTFNEGDSIHSYRPNRCLHSESYPCYCNPAVSGQIECPYCWVSSASGDLFCMNNEESMTFTSEQGSLETCECFVSDTESNSFTTDCRPAAMSPQARQDNDKNETATDDSSGSSSSSSSSSTTTSSSSSDTCIIDGLFFDRGQALGFAYNSGCGGLTFDTQCVCNPDLPDQVECPFCYFDIWASQDPLCVRDGEIVTLRDPTGETKTCGCTVSAGGTPESNCFLPSDQANTCVIGLPDGTYQTFTAGESLHRSKPSRCGADYPCYCDPSIRGQIWCPYCVFPESRESLICARDGEEITYTNFQTQQRETCSCTIPTDSSQAPVSTCTGAFSTQELPSQPSQPTQPTNNAGDDDDDDDNGVTVQTPDNGSDGWRACQFDGGKIFFEGENVGDAFATRCGSPEDFPCFCNPDNNPPVDCPYCGFALQGGSLLCLKDSEVARFVDIDGDELMCGCVAPTGSQPKENCVSVSPADMNTCVIRKENGDVFTYQAGDVIDDDVLPISYCGPNYPCYCDPFLEGQINCPFCVEVDFGGELICADAGEVVSFQGDDGQTQSCVCDVPQDPLDGEPILNCDGSRPTSNNPVDNPFGNVCSVKSPTGETVNIPDGDPFGDLVADGVCGPSSDWPSFCNAGGSNSSSALLNEQIEYPYCIFENTLFGETVCATDNGRVSFTDDTGAGVTCSCIFDDPPRTSCFPSTDGNVNQASGAGRTAIRMVVALGLVSTGLFIRGHL